MMPAVTVLSSPRGLPIAMAVSPGRTLSESPSGATGSRVATTLTTATSVRGSEPITLPVKLRPSVRLTVTSLAPSTTWALVSNTPSERVMKPEPWPCCWRIPGPRPKGPPTGLIVRLTVSIRTTAGPAFSTAATIGLPLGWSGAGEGASLRRTSSRRGALPGKGRAPEQPTRAATTASREAVVARKRGPAMDNRC